ncbi:S9 family peptidase [Teredinibacter sp. KSP-S5-2]|uniref:S9 family peptidase n=1 Tax=Teredinibacter sp. KSP-S5-2 TaxID=3034506 RepID=UPI0029345F05|nr:S9 family peptidase [Teredinibacter sp. KSP-S5-2]WNO10340.1 S9 family peptidase [Teredinibacter sp. KSP-S5-2]
MNKQAPFGSWESPISADMVAGKTPKISETHVDGNRIFWLETLAEEKGRCAIMMHKDGQNQCVLPRPLSAKTKAHEYGGGSYCVVGETIYFILADDQRIYRLNLAKPEYNIAPLTPESQQRFANIHYDETRDRLIAVCEDHSCISDNTPYPQNYLVSLDIKASTEEELPCIHPTPLHQGQDFYSNPCVSPDGNWLTWLTWNHPDMPWDASQLWLAEINKQGQLLHPKVINSNRRESIFQPQWSPAGDLFFVSDQTDWWNLYFFSAKDISSSLERENAQTVYPCEAEFATPQWVFGMSTYAFLDENTLITCFTRDGQWQLGKIHLQNNKLEIIETGLNDISDVSANSGTGAFIGASATSFPSVYQHNATATQALTEQPVCLDDGYISIAQAFTFNTGENQRAHAFYYSPKNKDYASNGPAPLIVLSHGGPTGSTSSSLNLKIQFWTSRGFAVVDVNYRGSTGYGRQYREQLYPLWGIADVEDVCAAADYVVKSHWADPSKKIIKGSSAGGYTTLAALAFSDTFSAGVSLYGIGDLELLAQDTHKFEARYLDKLIGAYPEEKDTYIKRSPLYATERISCPIILFQGLDDKVVPPNQAEQFVQAVDQQGLPVSYVTYADEGHGFRNSGTVIHMLNAELEFYCKIFGIHRDDQTDVLEIKNLSN